MLPGPLPKPEHAPENGSPEPPEDPFPSRTRTRSRPSRRTAPAHRFAAGVAIPVIAPCCAAVAAPPLDGALSWIHVLVSVAGVLLAALGAVAAASLLGYSRTLLAQEIAEEMADEEAAVRDDLHAEVARYDTEYLAVAFVFTVAGWILGLWSLRLAVAPELYLTALIAFGSVMLLVAGTLPVAAARSHAERTLLAVRPVVRAAWFVLRWPLVLPLLLLTRAALWTLRLEARPNSSAEVHKQVIAAVADSSPDALAGEERAWIGNILELRDLQVSTIMTPRPDIVAFAEDTPLMAAIEQALAEGFSRYPIFHERIDEVVGVLYVKDALRVLHGEPAMLQSSTVKSMMRETLFVPETMSTAQLLRRFQAGNQHMAIVLDEYGSTVGVVSVEDVLEQIVGDIADEYDEEPEDNDDERVTVIEPGRVVELPGRATVGDVNELLGSSLPEEGDYETVAGLVIARSNRIPQQDETVLVDEVEFRVLLADERRLVRLRATLVTAQPTEPVG
jgi:putative hemolysin